MDNLRWTLLFIGIAVIVLVYLFSHFDLWEKFSLKREKKAPTRNKTRERKAPVYNRHANEVETEEDEISNFTVSDFEEDISSFQTDFDEDEYHHDSDEEWHEVMAESRKPAAEHTDDEPSDTVPLLDELVEVDEEETGFEPGIESGPRQAELGLDIKPLVLSLTVISLADAWMDGPTLKQALEVEGLSYGDMGIFHYYSGDKSRPVFSVASVVEPGTFDLDTLDDLLIPGITLFCQLPGPLTPVETFKRMQDCASSLAIRLHARVCDDRRNAITAQSLAHYHDRIAAFNRELVLAQKK